MSLRWFWYSKWKETKAASEARKWSDIAYHINFSENCKYLQINEILLKTPTGWSINVLHFKF